MELNKTLDAVEKLTKAMYDQAFVECLQTYAAVSRLLDEIENYARESERKGEDIGLAKLYLTEMREPLADLAGIGIRSPGQKADFLTWVNTGVGKLRSVHAFNLRA